MKATLIYRDSDIEVYGLPRNHRPPTGKQCPECGNPFTRKAGFGIVARVKVGDIHQDADVVRVQRYICQRCGKNFRDEPK